MGQVTTQTEEKTLSKLKKPENDFGLNKQKGPLFDQLMDPLTDPLASGDGGGGEGQGPIKKDQLEAQQGANTPPEVVAEPPTTGGESTSGETQSLQSPSGEDQSQGEGTDKQSSDKTDESAEDQTPETKAKEQKGETEAEDPNKNPDKQEPGGEGKGDPKGGPSGGPKGGGKPGSDSPAKQDASTPGGGVGGTGGDTGNDEDQGGSSGGGGTGPDGKLLDYAGLSAGELQGYVNEKAWHDYWVHRSDTGMSTSDKWSLVGNSLGAGAMEGLVNGVSAGVIQGFAATALKKMRFAGGVFTAVDMFRMGPKNWALQSGDKFASAGAKWQTGDAIDKLEALLDGLDGINTIIGQLSGVCMMVAGLGSIIAVASIFFPFLLPIVPILLPIISWCANFGMILGKINAVIGAVLTVLRILPITLRAGQILLSDADPALQAARGEKLAKQVSSFTEDASARLAKKGTETVGDKTVNKVGGLFGNNKITPPAAEASNKVSKTDEKIGFFKTMLGGGKSLLKTAFDGENLSPGKIKEDFGNISKANRSNKIDREMLKMSNADYRETRKTFSESSGKAQGLEALQGTLTQNMMSNKVSNKEADLFRVVGGDALNARAKADMDLTAMQSQRRDYREDMVGSLFSKQLHSGEEFTGESAKGYRDLIFNSKAKNGTDGGLESLKSVSSGGSTGSTDLPDDKLKASDPKLYQIKMNRAGEAQKARADWVGGQRDKIADSNKSALDQRKMNFPQGSDEFSAGQSQFSDRIMDLGTATSGATVDSTMDVGTRSGQTEAQQKARNELRPKIQEAMNAVDAVRDGLQALPPPPEEQESVLTNAAINAGKIEDEIQSLESMKGEVAARKDQARAQAQTAQQATQLGKENQDKATKEKALLQEKDQKRKKAQEDFESKEKQTGQGVSPLGGFMSGVTDMVAYMMRLSGILPDSVGGDQVRAADPKALQEGLQNTQSTGKDSQLKLAEGSKHAKEQGQIGAQADNWINTGLTGLMTINARLAKDQADSQSAKQQFDQAEMTLVERLAKLEAGRDAQRQRHAAAMASIQGWTQAHRAERLKKQGDLDAKMGAVDNLLQASGQPTSAQVG